LVLPLEKLRERYHRASYLLCASRTDATPNMSLEGMACGCVLVTTRVGNALEFGVDGENVQFFDGQIDGLLMAMQRAREQRAHLAAAGTHLLRNAWSYGPPGDRAQYFFQLF